MKIIPKKYQDDKNHSMEDDVLALINLYVYDEVKYVRNFFVKKEEHAGKGNPYRAKDGKYTTGPGKGVMKMSEDEYYSIYKSTKTPFDKAAEVVTNLSSRNGFNKTPEVIEDSEYEALSDSDYYKQYRGIVERGPNGEFGGDNDNFKQQFMHGDYYAGTGDFGAGIYTTSANDIAVTYSEQKINGEYMNPTLKVAIPKSAKLITKENAIDLARKSSEKYYKKFEETGDSKYRDLYTLTSDIGVTAMMNGYDGIIYEGSNLRKIAGNRDQLINILNRGIVKVSKEYEL